MALRRWVIAGFAVGATALLGGFAPTLDLPGSTALEQSGWTLVTASDDTNVYMRAATTGQAGLRRVWTAYDAARTLKRDGFSFR